ncbi:MAG: hypothetical protein LBG43_06100 [Treponema sp.]|nr:hypothetical protein [Treponema sp.]
MISSEFKTFMIELLASWQVIVAAVIVMLYIALVHYVTHFNHEVKVKTAKVKKEKIPKAHKKKGKETEENDEEDEEDEPRNS